MMKDRKLVRADQRFATALNKAMTASGFEIPQAQARVMRDALEQIAKWDVNLRGDDMAKAVQLALTVDAMQSLALAALTGEKRRKA